MEVEPHNSNLVSQHAKDQWGPVAVGLVALALASIFIVYELSRFDWEPTQFAAFGEEATEIRSYAEDRLDTVKLRSQLGHDGRFFFVQANDPWVLDPNENAQVLDRPLYRSQRMLYPALAGGLGLFGPEAIIWAMLLLNLAAMGLGSWAVAWIAVSLGGPVWAGLAFVLNIGFISELDVGGAGILAGAAAFGALALVLNGRTWAGVVLLTMAALSREVMLVVAAGAAFYLWRRDEKRDAVAAALLPLAAVVVWAVYLRLRLSVDAGLSEVQEIGIPFLGIIQAIEWWIKSPVDLVMGIVILLILGLFTRRALLQDNIVGWALIGFVPLALLLTEQVWHSYFDITRGVAPLMTAFVLLVAVDKKNSPPRRTIRRSVEQARDRDGGGD